jgi:serine/threonine protein kinase
MPNDKETSQLVSRSLSGRLLPEELNAMEDELASSEQTQRFARLSRLIQDSLSDVAHRSVDGDESVAPGLSAAAKRRIRNKLRDESARQSQMGLGETLRPSGLSSAEAFQWNPSLAARAEDVGDVRDMRSRFTLQRKLGQGGLGTVWLAIDEKLKRSVALKEMSPDAARNPRAWERFHREAEITGHLEHPNVVPLYQFGTNADTGTPFYAMRFVGKRTLVDAIEEYHDRRAAGEDVTMDLHRLLSAFNGVCQAIAYAHSRGIVHRDLKPENVALDNFGQVIVLDWGLAKLADEHDAGAALSGEKPLADSSHSKTLAGEVIGTPLYMAPEQAAGKLDKVDARTDVYGLGAILFAMLTGEAPHLRKSATDGEPVPVAELVRRIADEESPRPRDIVSGIPADLESICRQAIHVKAHSRYQSAAELADAIQQWMAGRSHRRQTYSNARGEGRELRLSLQSSVRDLERNVRFMAALPPIQGIIDTENGRVSDDMSVWRDRLRVIYTGLLRTNCDFCSVSFSRVSEGNFSELIRIERQISEASNIRSIPASRLASGPLTTCMSNSLNGHPDEVYIALSSECPDERRSSQQGTRLAAGVPVFDSVTEELFGFVMIEACLERLIETQVRARLKTARRLFVLDNDCRVLLHYDREAGRVREYEGRPMKSMSETWDTILEGLKGRGEFTDEQDHAFYATRIDLVPGRYSLALAMCLAEKSACSGQS